MKLYGAIIVIGLLSICIAPWIYKFYTTSGEKRDKHVCCIFQCIGIFLFMLIVGSSLLFLLGERSDFIGVVALLFYMVGSFTIGPYLGKRFFVLVMKNKLGKVGAEQICKNAMF